MRKGTVWITLGVLLIAAALLITVQNLREAEQAGVVSENVLIKLDSARPKPPAPSAAPAQEEPTPTEIEIPDYSLNPNIEMPTETVDGNAYIGVLELPSLELKLPVLSEWSYSGLKLAPCRYAGSAYLNNMVIAAHNYSTHFGYLGNLAQGDEVVFTDVDGNVFRYQVLEVETLSPFAVEEMTDGDWDLTLFTCTISGRSRVTVRCALTEE